MRLILVRHGETQENATDIVQGQIPGTLSRLGEEQAGAVGTFLAGERADAVYASDLERARHSARLALGQDHDRILTDKRLREQSFGVLEGEPVSVLLDEMRRQKADWSAFDPPGGETRRALHERAEQFLGEIAALYEGETVVVFTHYGVINALLTTLLGKSNGQDYDVANGSVTVLRMDDRETVAEAVNDTGHLSVEALSPTRLPNP